LTSLLLISNQWIKLFGYPTRKNPEALKKFEEDVEKPAEEIIGNRSNLNLKSSAPGKVGVAVMMTWALVGVGLILRLNGIELGDFAGLVGGVALGIKSIGGNNAITEIAQMGTATSGNRNPDDSEISGERREPTENISSDLLKRLAGLAPSENDLAAISLTLRLASQALRLNQTLYDSQSPTDRMKGLASTEKSVDDLLSTFYKSLQSPQQSALFGSARTAALLQGEQIEQTPTNLVSLIRASVEIENQKIVLDQLENKGAATPNGLKGAYLRYLKANEKGSSGLYVALNKINLETSSDVNSLQEAVSRLSSNHHLSWAERGILTMIAISRGEGNGIVASSAPTDDDLNPNFGEIVKLVENQNLPWSSVKAAYAKWLRQEFGEEKENRFLHILNELPFVAHDKDGTWLADQPELYMKAVVQALRIAPNALGTPVKIDSVVMEALFYYTRSMLKQMLNEKKVEYKIKEINWNLSPEEKYEVMRGAIGFSTLAARLGWGKIATEVAMELWVPHEFHSTSLAYEDRLGLNEAERAGLAKRLNRRIGNILMRSNWNVATSSEDFFNINHGRFALVMTRAKGTYSVVNKILRERRKNREYGMDWVNDLLTTKIVLEGAGETLEEWRMSVSRLLFEIATDFNARFDEFDERDEWGGGALHTTLYVPFKDNQGKPKTVPLELQFFSKDRYMLLNLGAGAGAAKSKPYWMYKAAEFIRHVFTDGKDINLNAVEFMKTVDWKGNLVQLAEKWSDENVVRVIDKQGKRYIGLPGRGEGAATFIDLAQNANKIRWDSKGTCYIYTPMVDGKPMALSGTVPFGVVVSWANERPLYEDSRVNLRKDAKLIKTARALTPPRELLKRSEDFTKSIGGPIKSLAEWGVGALSNEMGSNGISKDEMRKRKIARTAEVMKKLEQRLARLAEEHKVPFNDFKALVYGTPSLLFPEPQADKEKRFANKEIGVAKNLLTDLYNSLSETKTAEPFENWGEQAIVNLLSDLGILNEEETEVLQSRRVEGSRVSGTQKSDGSEQFTISTGDRLGLFQAIMKAISNNQGDLISAKAKKGTHIVLRVDGARNALSKINEAFKRIPSKGPPIGRTERDVLLTIHVSFNPHPLVRAKRNLTGLSLKFAELITGRGGDIKEIDIDSTFGNENFRLVVAMSQSAFRGLEGTRNGQDSLNAIRRELQYVDGELKLKFSGNIGNAEGAEVWAVGLTTKRTRRISPGGWKRQGCFWPFITLGSPWLRSFGECRFWPAWFFQSCLWPAMCLILKHLKAGPCGNWRGGKSW
jgi:hypothetical protein